MAAGNFIKDNLALVAGIAVPVLLVVGFLLTSTLGKLLTAPPAHKAYFVLQENDYNKKVSASTDIKVSDDGALIVTVTPVKPRDNSDHYNTQTDILVTYDAATDTLTEHRFSAPQGKTTATFTPDEFKNVRLSTQPQAADGYSVTYGNRGGRSLVADIFVARGADGYRLRKSGAVYRLPDRAVNGVNTTYYNRYYNLRFLGWGTEKNQ